jgi:hypothetical protein
VSVNPHICLPSTDTLHGSVKWDCGRARPERQLHCAVWAHVPTPRVPPARSNDLEPNFAATVNETWKGERAYIGSPKKRKKSVRFPCFERLDSKNCNDDPRANFFVQLCLVQRFNTANVLECLASNHFYDLFDKDLSKFRLQLHTHCVDVLWIESMTVNCSTLILETSCGSYWFGFSKDKKPTESFVVYFRIAMSTHLCIFSTVLEILA